MKPVKTFVAPPDPGAARTIDELVERLRSLKVWAGDPSYEMITDRINAGWSAAGRPTGELARRGTVVDCFKLGRRRLNPDLLLGVVRALHPDEGYVAHWTQALRVTLGETQAAAQVRAQDKLPDDLTEFTGRTVQLDRLRDLLRRGHETGGAVVISAIEGMAGVGKTQLAVHAGHLLAAEQPFEHILFVNLRGFHPDPAQPPADPAAVLDSFLRLLGVSGQQIPHDAAARAAMFRERLAGKRALVVLDNAANEAQVRPLLPDNPGCLTLVTSRRHLTGLQAATHLAVDVFTPDEALEFLKRAVPDVPIGDDPDALMRVAQRCGLLPLALDLLAAQMRAMPGWTVTDHADRLDQRHHNHRLDSGVELALTVSYQHLPPQRQRLLRLLSSHPGDDFDGYAAAALADSDLDTARDHLYQLCTDHLLQQSTPGRYVLHDLVRAYAADRAGDEDRPTDRRAALTRLFDFYLHTAAAAAKVLAPQILRLPLPSTPPRLAAAFDGHALALAWFDAERTNLLAAATYAAEHGPRPMAWMLADVLRGYLSLGMYASDWSTVATSALSVARAEHHLPAQAAAHLSLATLCMLQGRYPEARAQYGCALKLARRIGWPECEAAALGNLAVTLIELGQLSGAAEHLAEALAINKRLGRPTGQATNVANLAYLHAELGHLETAVAYGSQAVTLNRELGSRSSEAIALTNLGSAYQLMGRLDTAMEQLTAALTLHRELGNRSGEVDSLSELAMVHQQAGRLEEAYELAQSATLLAGEIGHDKYHMDSLNVLGTVHHRLGRCEQAIRCHQEALELARACEIRSAEAESLIGLATVHLDLGQYEVAAGHIQRALDLTRAAEYRLLEGKALTCLAHVHLAQKQYAQARRYAEEALEIHRATGYRLGQESAQSIRALVG